MIRNIVFDMGQVLIRFDLQMFLEVLEVPEADRELYRREVFGSVEWVQMDRGVLTLEAGAEAMRRRLPPRLHPCVDAMVLHWWERWLIPVPGMDRLLGELKELGCGIYLLSNATPRIHDYFSRIPGSEYFDGKVVSADHRQLKPEREIYRTLLEGYHLAPESCFFVDDLSINVEGARFAGMDGFVFRGDVGELRRALRAAGVPVRETP